MSSTRTSINQLLILAFALVVGLFAVVALWAQFSLGRVADSATLIGEGALPREAQLATLLDSYNQIRLKVRNNIIFTDPEAMKAEEALYRKEKARYLAAVDALQALNATLGATDEEKRLTQALRERFAEAMAAQDKAMQEAMQFLSTVAMNVLTQEARPKMAALEEAVGAYSRLIREQSRERAGEIARDANRTRSVSLALAAFAAALAGLLGWRVSRSIRVPLDETVRAMERVAEGDLTVRLVPGGGEELVRLQGAAMRTVDSLGRTLAEISRDARGLKAAAVGLTAATAAARGSASDQSAAAREMADTLARMTDAIAAAATLGDEAQTLSRAAGGQASDGSRVIGDLMGEIDGVAAVVSEAAANATRLGAESERISAITSAIRDVADQTNLLALNAAIEAARAGEAGRGFAVVADEVRKLAEKTNTSAAEIAAMVDSIQGGARAMAEQMQRSVARVDKGLQLAREAGVAIAAIDGGAGRVVGVIEHVSAALDAQAQASRHVAQRVERIVGMIDDNNRTTATVAETAGQLDGLASGLEAGIGRFRLA